MNNYKQLKAKIDKKRAKICIIGLGYVGLPLVVNFAKKNFFVYGYDTNSKRIKRLEKGKKYIADIESNQPLKLIKKNKFMPIKDERCIGKADIIIICVPTPLRKVKTPDISFVKKASKTIKKYIKKGQLIILESTSYPTTTREVVLPELKKSGLVEEKDFFLCFSPERVSPGDKKHPVTKIPKLVGGLSSRSTKLAKSLYSKIIKEVHSVSSPEVAETSKLLENTYRLVNIALILEFTIVAEKLGISIWEVIEAAKTKPFGFMPFYPGPGIGGHCIPTDPKFLSWKSKKMGFKTKMIDLASYIDHFMPDYVIKRVDKALGKKKINNSKILILGVTYKKDVKDLRESPALDIIEKLQKRKIKVDYYDPLVPYLKVSSINLKRASISIKNLKKYDCVVVVTGHKGVDYQRIRKNAKLIFDTRNVYKKDYKNVKRL
ncbi:MAG: nucleotide sugar dehydrogenase [Candidatus Omnitrophica bacterium]|nr:nucleotide sugar dehydrogenase [Candidatus Omnitrophota bacterium]MCF7893993.1 nucleotide sugar dehydrogenase [Candidatus Omnitrophota bacterium]